ncbi:hypothetical protein C7M84_015321 [Penaeus vannamei]|uniref:Uncharacterized protein n=1 Tax=Penaeus vannamei TaxID=6689 RepID=A0A423SR11_PENVA|nr:hypothetical protein C7M84_015321 [Penaeus vannamei]
MGGLESDCGNLRQFWRDRGRGGVADCYLPDNPNDKDPRRPQQNAHRPVSATPTIPTHAGGTQHDSRDDSAMKRVIRERQRQRGWGTAPALDRRRNWSRKQVIAAGRRRAWAGARGILMAGPQRRRHRTFPANRSLARFLSLPPADPCHGKPFRNPLSPPAERTPNTSPRSCERGGRGRGAGGALPALQKEPSGVLAFVSFFSFFFHCDLSPIVSSPYIRRSVIAAVAVSPIQEDPTSLFSRRKPLGTAQSLANNIQILLHSASSNDKCYSLYPGLALPVVAGADREPASPFLPTAENGARRERGDCTGPARSPRRRRTSRSCDNPRGCLTSRNTGEQRGYKILSHRGRHTSHPRPHPGNPVSLAFHVATSPLIPSMPQRPESRVEFVKTLNDLPSTPCMTTACAPKSLGGE